MNKGKYVYSQLLSFLDPFIFLRISKKYDGDKYVKHFTCWNQLAVLMFGQLSNRESLRDVVLATQAYWTKAMDLITYEENSFYIFDRGYNDFKPELWKRRFRKNSGILSKAKGHMNAPVTRDKNLDLLGDYSLLHDGHRPEKAGNQAVHLRDAIDSKYLTYRHYQPQYLVRQI